LFEKDVMLCTGLLNREENDRSLELKNKERRRRRRRRREKINECVLR